MDRVDVGVRLVPVDGYAFGRVAVQAQLGASAIYAGASTFA